jgi:hypothetical protein
MKRTILLALLAGCAIEAPREHQPARPKTCPEKYKEEALLCTFFEGSIYGSPEICMQVALVEYHDCEQQALLRQVIQQQQPKHPAHEAGSTTEQ